MTGSLLALAALAANGCSEGYHWQELYGSGEIDLLSHERRDRMDIYHMLTGVQLWGGIAALYFGVTLAEAFGLALFGVMGVRDWMENWMTRGHPFRNSTYPLHFWKVKTMLVRRRWFRIPVIATGAALLILSWLKVL